MNYMIYLADLITAQQAGLALRYIHLKQYTEARKALERYVELFPEDDFVRGLLLKVKNSDTSSRR